MLESFLSFGKFSRCTRWYWKHFVCLCFYFNFIGSPLMMCQYLNHFGCIDSILVAYFQSMHSFWLIAFDFIWCLNMPFFFGSSYNSCCFLLWRKSISIHAFSTRRWYLGSTHRCYMGFLSSLLQMRCMHAGWFIVLERMIFQANAIQGLFLPVWHQLLVIE